MKWIVMLALALTGAAFGQDSPDGAWIYPMAKGQAAPESGSLYNRAAQSRVIAKLKELKNLREQRETRERENSALHDVNKALERKNQIAEERASLYKRHAENLETAVVVERVRGRKNAIRSFGKGLLVRGFLGLAFGIWDLF